MLVTNVKVQIVVSLKAIVANAADERLLIDVSLQMTFDVRLGWKTLSADVTVVGLCIFVEAFVENPQALDFEVLLAESTFERPLDGMSDEMTVQIFLSFEALFAHSALEVENIAMSRLVTLHVRLLDESFAAKATLVWPFASVQKHVSVKAECLGKVLVADVAVVDSVFCCDISC